MPSCIFVNLIFYLVCSIRFICLVSQLTVILITFQKYNNPLFIIYDRSNHFYYTIYSEHLLFKHYITHMLNVILDI